jgi:hypothetical protein
MTSINGHDADAADALAAEPGAVLYFAEVP